MTARRRDVSGGTPFGKWLRENPSLDSQSFSLGATDCDMWVHKFRHRTEHGNDVRGIDNLMLVEIKCRGDIERYSQRDTLSVIYDILRGATVRNGRRRTMTIPDRRRGRVGVARKVRWFGVHVLRMSAETPDASDLIMWDRRVIDRTTLVRVLRFDNDPDSPFTRLDTRRHHLTPFRDVHPVLFSALI